MEAPANPVVHLELHTPNLPRACTFYTALLGWRAERIRVGASSYVSLGLAAGIDGGILECEQERPLWIPYVEVADVAEATERARLLGATVHLEPREGPGGWRSVVAASAAAEVALWAPKR